MKRFEFINMINDKSVDTDKVKEKINKIYDYISSKMDEPLNDLDDFYTDMLIWSVVEQMVRSKKVWEDSDSAFEICFKHVTTKSILV